MTLAFIRIVIVSIAILACIFLPFIPGNYDGSAVAISSMAQLFGFVSLLFVPTGFLWLISELTRRGEKQQQTGSFRFAFAALITFCVVSIIVSFGAFSIGSSSLGIASLILCTYAVLRMINKIKLLKNQDNGRFNNTPLYLIFIPTIVVFFRFLLIEPATEFSRNYAIRQSEALIQDIEAYQKKYGTYPVSLLSLNVDYKPSVLGIQKFHYEPQGNAYKIYFEQFCYVLDSKEIVMYNKLDEHSMNTHEMDILEFTGNELAIRRGDRRKFDLPQPHWKYFWFD